MTNIFSYGQGSCYVDQSNGYWKIGETQYGSIKLSGCSPSAYYNCHGFMMSFFEVPESAGCPKPSWTNSVATPYLCPNSFGRESSLTWQNSGRYIHVCLEADGQIAYYQFIQGDHSAVKTVNNGQIKYMSKYSYDGPLVAHNLMGSWYHLTGQDNGTPVQFWSYLGPIKGNATIIGVNPIKFKVNPIQNVNYYWSILGSYANIYISTGANQNEVTLVPTHSGTAVLHLDVSSGCDSGEEQEITLNITTNICLEGSYDNAGIYLQNLNTTNRVSVGGVFIRVSCPNSTTIDWQKTSGNINGYFPPGSTASFQMTSGGSITLLITAKNGSTTVGTRSVTFYNY